MTRKTPTCIADCKGDDVVRVDAGLVHLTSRLMHGERWAVLLDDDGSETRGRLFLAGNTRVLELVRPARQGEARSDEEVRDPLRGAAQKPKGGLL